MARLQLNHGKKNFVHFFPELEEQHLGKDNCISANHVGSMEAFDSYLVYFDCGQRLESKGLNPHLRYHGIKINAGLTGVLGKIDRAIKFLKFFIANARCIDVLFFVHFSTSAKLITALYKAMNPRGKVWIKMDVSSDYAQRIFDDIDKGQSRFKYFLNRVAAKQVDVMSYENSESATRAGKYYPCAVHYPNPINFELIESLGIEHSGSSPKKENLIITVARIGAEVKQHGMMLDAISSVDLKEWKFLFIGPIDEGFKVTMAEFYEKNPGKIDSVKFVGPIYSKADLYAMYARARVFCLTSKCESNSNAQTDSLYFGLFNISTPVSGINDLAASADCVQIVNNHIELASTLQKIANGGIDFDWVENKVKKHAIRFKISRLFVPIATKLGL